ARSVALKRSQHPFPVLRLLRNHGLSRLVRAPAWKVTKIIHVTGPALRRTGAYQNQGVHEMNKFLIAAITLTLATPALAQGMAAHDTMAGPSAMAHDGMK